MGETSRGRILRIRTIVLVTLWAGAALRSTTLAGLVDLELRPATQTVSVGDPVELGVFALSADGGDQSVGFVGVVVVWDASALSLNGHDDTGAFTWTNSAFPSDGAGVNDTFFDGDAYYQAVVSVGGPYATATAGGALVTTLQFTALAGATGSTVVSIISCVDSTCTRVLDAHPFDTGVSDVTGSIATQVDVIIECQSDAQCDDGNPCTDDACDAGQACAFVADDSNDADDGAFCNGLEVCSGGVVVVVPDSVPDCDDALTCTTDVCDEVADTCVHTINTGQCLIAEACYANGALNPLNDCQRCTSALEAEAWSPRAFGTSCGDPTGTECDAPDTCDGAGICLDNLATFGTPCGDPTSSMCTAPDTCDGGGNCARQDAADGTPCDDNQFCTLVDECQEGLCTGSGEVCPGQTCDAMEEKCKAVDLELLPASQGPVAVGDVVDVQLVARSDTELDQPISAMSAVLAWPSAGLELAGVVNNGPYSWLLSGFPDDSGLDGVNNTFADGNALYQASSMPEPNPPAVATVEGLLVTTLQFRTRAVGSFSVEMRSATGSFTHTTVLDAETDGLDITGSLALPASITVVECLGDTDCDDGEFCTGVESCVDMVCTAGSPPDCDDGTFCNGIESCEPTIGCVSPGNPCPDPDVCDELAENCGGCEAPVVEAEGARYFAVTPPPGTDPLSILVIVNPEGTAESLAVQADGTLGQVPAFLTPAEWGTVHVATGLHPPQTTFDVHSNCRFDGSGSISHAIRTRTWRWGDANGDGAVQVGDINLVFQGSQGSFPEGVSVENLDLAPCVADRTVDAEDVQAAQDAFAGQPFPYVGSCDVCAPTDPPAIGAGVGPRNRYLVVNPGNGGTQAAIRVTIAGIPQPFSAWTGAHLYAGTPVQACENSGQGLEVSPPNCGPAPGAGQRWIWVSRLSCGESSAAFMDWSTLTQHCVGGTEDGAACVDGTDCPGGSCGSSGDVHLYGVGVIPSRMASSTGPIHTPAEYVVQMVDSGCPLSDEASYSDGIKVTQAGWSDVVTDCTGCPCGPPNEDITVIGDVVALVNKFSNSPCAVRTSRGDLEPALVDFRVTFVDVVEALGGFTGGHYPLSSGPCIDNVCADGPLEGASCASVADCVPDLCPPE